MKKQFLAPVTGLLFAALLFTACKKDDNDTPQQDARVMLVNASPGDSVASDFYFNDIKLDKQPVLYPTNSGYLTLAPASYTIKVAAVNTINPSAEGSAGLSSGKTYSVFSYDTLLAGKKKVFAVEDDVTAPATNMSKVRFFHLAPASIAVDIYANDSLVFANRSYADNVANSAKGAFISVAAGTYTVKVKLAGTSSNIPPLLTLSNISFAAGTVNTIFAKGTVNGKGVNALGAELIVNK